MSKMQREKGKRGERLWRDKCREQGYTEVRRTSQYCGQTGDASDCVGLPGIHQEVKFVEKLNVRNALTQAINDSHDKAIPIVAHKTSNCEWLVTMRADDWFNLYKEWELDYTAKMMMEGKM